MTASPRRRLAFGAAVVLALAMHGALLALPRDAHGIELIKLGQAARPIVWLAAPPEPATAQPSPPVVDDPSAHQRVAVARQPDPASARSNPTLAPSPTPTPAQAAPVPDPQAPKDQPTIAPDKLARYRPASELTVRALIADPIDLKFHSSTAQAQRGGRARLLVLVSAEGTVDQVVIESSTLDPGFQNFALARFYGARFQPGQLDGVAVPARAIFEITDDEAG